MRKSYIISAVIAVAFLGWLFSGQFIDAADDGATVTGEIEPGAERALPQVRVAIVEAQTINQEVVVYGRTEPARDVEIKAETYGRVVGVMTDEGTFVEAGQPIVTLDTRERQAMLQGARAEQRQREIEYQAALKLGEKGFQTETAIAEAEAELESAKARVRQWEITLDHTEIRAPFSGILERRHVEIGDYLDTGEAVGLVIEQNPFLVTAEITEAFANVVQPGMAAHAELATGQRVSGRVTFVGTQAQPGTRTIPIEVRIENPNKRFASGVSATVTIELPPVSAHRISSALLSLNDQGRVGVKLVDDEDRVQFVPADIARAETDAIWVEGLPERARVITVGQGFVRDGEKVRTISEKGPQVGAADSKERRGPAS